MTNTPSGLLLQALLRHFTPVRSSDPAIFYPHAVRLSDMKTFVYGFAYLLIYTTPIQVLFLLWVAGLIVITDHSWLSLSTGIFLRDNIPFLYHWLYSWFWNAWLDFWWGFPALILGTIKLVTNTLIGIWLLRKARAMD
jgi:hypothetical protein